MGSSIYRRLPSVLVNEYTEPLKMHDHKSMALILATLST